MFTIKTMRMTDVSSYNKKVATSDTSRIPLEKDRTNRAAERAPHFLPTPDRMQHFSEGHRASSRLWKGGGFSESPGGGCFRQVSVNDVYQPSRASQGLILLWSERDFCFPVRTAPAWPGLSQGRNTNPPL